MHLEALSDELLTCCIAQAGDSGPADLARLACVSKRFRSVDSCWRAIDLQRFPELASVAEASDVDWKALYKLCAYCPPTSLLLPAIPGVATPQRGCAMPATAFRVVKAMLQEPGGKKKRRQTLTVHSGLGQTLPISGEALDGYPYPGGPWPVTFVWRGYAAAFAGSRLSGMMFARAQPPADTCAFCGSAACAVGEFLSKPKILDEMSRAERHFEQTTKLQNRRLARLVFQSTSAAYAMPSFGWGMVDPKTLDPRPVMHICVAGHLWASWRRALRTQGEAEYDETYAGWKMNYNGGCNMGEE